MPPRHRRCQLSPASERQLDRLLNVARSSAPVLSSARRLLHYAHVHEASERRRRPTPTPRACACAYACVASRPPSEAPSQQTGVRSEVRAPLFMLILRSLGVGAIDAGLKLKAPYPLYPILLPTKRAPEKVRRPLSPARLRARSRFRSFHKNSVHDSYVVGGGTD